MEGNTTPKLNCASFFSGVGGIDQGFAQTGFFQTIYANEFDKYPCETFNLNNPVTADCRDIRTVEASELPDFDVLLGGFPCQAFSIAGLRKGFNDAKSRGTLFFELLRIIKVKKPQVVFLENVKNLLTHNHGQTFSFIISSLKATGYHVRHQVLNAMEYGNIPQNRERIYIVAFLSPLVYDRFTFPAPIPLTTTLDDIIDFNSHLDEKYYYTPGKYKGDIYDKLIEAMDDDRAIYQWRRHYVRKNRSGVIPTLTANQGEGGHNVCLLKTPHGIRKMTPRECFNAQGFRPDFKLPTTQSESRLYKQAGNSVCVTVIERIAMNIGLAMRYSLASSSASSSSSAFSSALPVTIVDANSSITASSSSKGNVSTLRNASA